VVDVGDDAEIAYFIDLAHDFHSQWEFSAGQGARPRPPGTGMVL
jgi:hypothetical protein